MRVGFGISIFGHLAILGFGFVALPSAQPLVPEMIEALPVELVAIADETDLLAGDEQAEALPEEKPQPKPVVEAKAPAPEPSDKPAEKPVEAARQPVAAPPPPPEPELEVAALPEPAEPPPPPAEAPEPQPIAEPEPEPAKPIEARVPKARPKPPKQIVEPRPEEQERLRELAESPEPERFDTNDIAALLNKQEPSGGGDPLPAEEPQTLGSIDGAVEAAMTQSEIEALKARLYQCWTPPIGARETSGLLVTVRINLLQDGSLASPPQLVGIGAASQPLAQAAAESAIRAVNLCAPFGDILRPEKYAQWSQIDFVFDPQFMLGG